MNSQLSFNVKMKLYKESSSKYNYGNHIIGFISEIEQMKRMQKTIKEFEEELNRRSIQLNMKEFRCSRFKECRSRCFHKHLHYKDSECIKYVTFLVDIQVNYVCLKIKNSIIIN